VAEAEDSTSSYDRDRLSPIITNLVITARLAAAAFAFAITAHPNAIAAQTAGSPSAAMLVLSPTPLANGHVNVRRRSVTQPYDLIIVDGGASESDVASAVGLLTVMRARSGDPAKRDLRGTVTSVSPRAGQNPATDQATNAKRLHDLPHAASRSIQGLGKVHAIPISIP
jgi:hypothetical protein